MSQLLVEVELYIEGKGPEHVFRTPLGGWDQKRLDLEQIMNDYKLRAIYAYSLGAGRGQRLRYNPRNGLSVLPYSGKSDCVIRLDGDPKRSSLVPFIKICVGVSFILAMVACLFVDFRTDTLQALRDASAGKVMLVLCFGTMIVLQITRQARKRY